MWSKGGGEGKEEGEEEEEEEEERGVRRHVRAAEVMAQVLAEGRELRQVKSTAAVSLRALLVQKYKYGHL
jgi:hypothetical protein